jgi:hypothetical protein
VASLYNHRAKLVRRPNGGLCKHVDLRVEF